MSRSKWRRGSRDGLFEERLFALGDISLRASLRWSGGYDIDRKPVRGVEKQLGDSDSGYFKGGNF